MCFSQVLILNHLALDICIPEYLMSCLSKEDSGGVHYNSCILRVFRTSFASQPQDTDTTAMDTTTARRLPRRLATMSLLSPLLSQLLRLPTLSQSRPVSPSPKNQL